FMSQFKSSGIELPPGEFGIPPEDLNRPFIQMKARRLVGFTQKAPDLSKLPGARGRAVTAGGMVYVSSIGPVDPETGQIVPGGIKEQARQCLQNLKATLETAGTALDRVVWANWSLRDPTEFDEFNKEWVRWFPEESPVGQGTLMPPMQRR